MKPNVLYECVSVCFQYVGNVQSSECMRVFVCGCMSEGVCVCSVS